MTDSRKHRTIGLCGDRIVYFMRKRGWNYGDLANVSGVSRSNISLLVNNKHPATWKIAEKLRSALELESIDQLRPINDLQSDSSDKVNEWFLEEALTQWITASNQLQFRIWRMRHEHINKFSRGKCYDLVSMSSAAKEDCKVQLIRHAEVCSRIQNDFIISNLTTFEEATGDRWWVIDEWVEGKIMSDFVKEKTINLSQAKKISKQVLLAISVLHEHDIVCRELSPDTVVVKPEGSAILTEFELAKLLDGSPTVSNQHWKEDLYRAPEADSDNVDARADIYSWARITTELLLGSLPAVDAEAKALRGIELDKNVREALCKSLSVSRRLRPSSASELIEVFSDWSANE